MPWAATDKPRIIKYRAYSLQNRAVETYDDLDGLITAQQNLLTDETLIGMIQADLASLDTLDALKTTEQGSTNAALIKAGPIEWEPGGVRVSGIKSRMEELRLRIARILSQEITFYADTAGDGLMLF